MPGEAEELWLPDTELPLKVQNLIDFGESASEDINDIAEGASLRSPRDCGCARQMPAVH